MEKIKVNCFGLQGFGNDLIKGLANRQNVEILGIYTRKNLYEFGYYGCKSIEELADSLHIPVRYVASNEEWDCQAADLAIISSFHRILEEEHLEKFHYVINIHPSLLPDYKGATPTNWMVKNGEKIVGLTAHLVEKSIDSGPILFQKKLLNPYLNDNQLRKALSFLIQDMVGDIIDSYPDFETKKSNEKGTYQPPRSERDAIINLAEINNIEELIFHIKAFTNYPMPKVKIDDKIFEIDYENPMERVEITLNGETFNLLGKWK